MKNVLRPFTEALARKTSRRGLFGRGAQIATGAVLGVAAGKIVRPGSAIAGIGTICVFPGPACPCDGCRDTGICAKPCVINTTWYATGCWVSIGVTCCDCDCQGFQNTGVCGCGTDFHNIAANCPDGKADG